VSDIHRPANSYPTLSPDLAAAVASIPILDISDVVAVRALDDIVSESSRTALSYDGVELSEIVAPGMGNDPDVPIRLMRPTGAVGALPVLLAMHGGGFVLGRAQDFDYFCLEIVRQLGIAVANVEYRLAPETPFPGAVDDVYAALNYVHANSEELGVNPSRIAIGGSSAGGGIAAGTVLRARDEGGPPVAFQFLLSPALDDRRRTPSATQWAEPLVLSRSTGVLAWQYYLGAGYAGPDDPSVSPYAAPARAVDLTGLPPTYIAAMELDPVRDENIHYALRLLEAGVSVELHSHPGTFHGSVEMVPRAASSARIRRGILEALDRALNADTAASTTSR
jgi:acetyl esterase